MQLENKGEPVLQISMRIRVRIKTWRFLDFSGTTAKLGNNAALKKSKHFNISNPSFNPHKK